MYLRLTILVAQFGSRPSTREIETEVYLLKLVKGEDPLAIAAEHKFKYVGQVIPLQF